MKRLYFVLLLLVSVSLTAWAGVRLDIDSGDIGSASDRVEVTDTSVEGEVGGDLFLTVLGGGGVLDEAQSLMAVLTSSHGSIETSEFVTLDASGSQPGAGAITLYEWDLDGDGVFDESSTEGTLLHSFTDDGVVGIAVRITNDLGESAVSGLLQIDVINRQPLARFAVDLGEGFEGTPIVFVNASYDPDGLIQSWVWNFGDGSTSGEASPSHTYATAGVFSVTLNVVDDDEAWSESYEFEVGVSNLAPQAQFSMEHSSLRVGNPLLFADESFDPSSDGEIVHVAWDFGDGNYQAGSPSSNNVYSHTFIVPGTYTVTLYVIDDDGELGRFLNTVQIQ